MKTKELTIEEKAKAYDSMFERLKEMYNNNKTNVAARLTYERYFPELKESEDERIRKDIISYLKSSTAVSPKTWIEWLEKQGEQKSTDKVALMSTWSKEDERDFDIVRGIIYNSCNAEDASRLIEWFKSIKDRVQPQPQQQWSEEDESMRTRCIGILGKCYMGELPTKVEEELNWLKSLRHQNRCTYNPYKEVVESIAEMCEKYEDANLDSLKDFYSNVKVKCKDAKEYDSLFPQSTWKPSEEHVEAFEHFVRSIGESGYASPYDNTTKLLYSLLADLKKLREE